MTFGYFAEYFETRILDLRMEICNTSKITQVFRFAHVASGCDTSWF